MNLNIQEEMTKVYAYADEMRMKLMDEIVKDKQANHDQLVEIRKRILIVEEEIKKCVFVTNEHTQFIREFEIRQSIFESN